MKKSIKKTDSLVELFERAIEQRKTLSLEALELELKGINEEVLNNTEIIYPCEIIEFKVIKIVLIALISLKKLMC